MNSFQENTLDEDDDGEQDKTSEVYQKLNPILHPHHARGDQKLFSTDFIRKYIHYARSRNRPKLSDEAREIITEEYSALRSEQTMRTLPITPRCLETLIRLSTAHAKSRFSNVVQKVDCDVAIEVLRFALYNDLGKYEERKKKDKQKDHQDKEEELSELDESLSEEEETEEVEGGTNSKMMFKNNAMHNAPMASHWST